MASERSIAKVIGERLRGLRLQRGFTQRELARQVAGGVDVSFPQPINIEQKMPANKHDQETGRNHERMMHSS